MLSRAIHDIYYVHTGALKATGNRGLQPAMDHLLENEGKPVPELSGVSEAASSRPSAGGGGEPMDEDDAEDAAALAAVYGGNAAAAAAAADLEAKVRSAFLLFSVVLHWKHSPDRSLTECAAVCLVL